MNNTMIKNIKFFLIAAGIISVLYSCSRPQIELSVQNGKTVTFRNSGIQLRFDQNMYVTVSIQKNNQWLYLNDGNQQGPETLPSFFVEVDSQTVRDFRLNFESINDEKISTVFGTGIRLVLESQSGSTGIKNVLTIELYEDFPNSALASAEFINTSVEKAINLNAVYSNCYQLDVSLIEKEQSPHAFYSFYGTAGRPSRQIEKLLPANFDRENFTGRPLYLEGVKKGNGGIPIVDLWCREMGIGIGHIEPKWKDLYLPVKVQKDGKVFTAIKEIPGINTKQPFILMPGKDFKTVKSFVNVHTLDFYQTAKTYSELMQRQGIDMHTESTENDYLPAWCSWNDYSTHGMASKKDVMLIAPILQRLLELTELGIKEIIFDAGWFNNQGDWLPNTDPLSFPGGESDIIAAIDQIHAAGFKVKLWISYLTADPWSEVAKAHPEWMIKKAEGSFHLDRWSGYTMCPTLPEVQEYYRKLAERLTGKYGADGFKVDGMYVCPPCYNPLHQHKHPGESSEAYHKVFKAFYEAAKSVNSSTTIMACPCGTICDFTSLPFITETIAADPKTYESVRRKAKLYRALKGAGTPYSGDYIDIVKGNLQFPITLANAVGVGAVPQTFYGRTPPADTLAIYKKWFQIYASEMISQAQYLNLYDMHFDKPETHVFRKSVNGNTVFYFSFFADESRWNGPVEFRGLEKNREYRIYDYVNEKELGIIQGHSPEIDLAFENYLFVKCTELN